jgi:peptide/nickel transport system ATP-binding protein
LRREDSGHALGGESSLARLEISGLGVSFGTAQVLRGVTFGVEPGQRVGLIGDAGGGKSLVALACLGLIPIGASVTGTVTFDGKSPDGESAGLRGRRIGALLEDAADAFDPLQPAIGALKEALAAAGSGTDLEVAAEGWLAQVGVPWARANLYPDQLEVRERQLIAVAVALAGNPELLVADEPAKHLDLIAGRRVLDLIDRRCSEGGRSLLMISADLKAIAMLCTRVVVLHGGVIVEAGQKSDVLGRPKHDYTRTVVTSGRYRARALMRTPIGGTLLDVRGVSKLYRRPDISLFEPRPRLRALDDVTFTLRVGESMALIGPVDAGKTTLARIIVGLERASRGELEFDARVYHGPDLLPIYRPEITMLFRDPRQSFDPRRTLGESLAEPLGLAEERLVDDVSARIVEALMAVGMSADVLGRSPADFTMAQLQRLAVARAIVTRPKLVILDEPTAVLDISARGELLVLLDRLRADFGLTLLVTGRDLDTVRVIVDRVLVMDGGRIVETGTPAQLLANPQHDVTKRLVAAELPDVGIVPVF